MSEATYLQINYMKSGSLFECAAALGGLIASEKKVNQKTLQRFGRAFGDAYQIRDDICSIYNENRHDELSRIDLINGDISLPFIYAHESNTISTQDRNTLLMLYLGEKKTADIEEIQQIYDESGALERSIAKMKSFAEEGTTHLEDFEDCEAKEILLHLLQQYYIDFNPREKIKIIL